MVIPSSQCQQIGKIRYYSPDIGVKYFTMFHLMISWIRLTAVANQQHESVPVIRGYEGGPNGQSTGPDGERDDVSTGGK